MSVSVTLQRRSLRMQGAREAECGSFSSAQQETERGAPEARPSAWSVSPRDWRGYQWAQVAYATAGACECALVRHVVWQGASVSAPGVVGTQRLPGWKTSQAPGVLCLVTGLLNLVVGVGYYPSYVALVAKATNPFKCIKLTAHMVLVVAVLSSLCATESSALPTAALAGWLFLVLEHVMYYSALLREFQIRQTPLAEAFLPLVLSAFAFCAANAQLATSSVRHVWAATPASALAHSVLAIQFVFAVIYALHVVWVALPYNPQSPAYRWLEAGVELLLAAVRAVFWRAAAS